MILGYAHKYSTLNWENQIQILTTEEAEEVILQVGEKSYIAKKAGEEATGNRKTYCWKVAFMLKPYEENKAQLIVKSVLGKSTVQSFQLIVSQPTKASDVPVFINGRLESDGTVLSGRESVFVVTARPDAVLAKIEVGGEAFMSGHYIERLLTKETASGEIDFTGIKVRDFYVGFRVALKGFKQVKITVTTKTGEVGTGLAYVEII